MAEADVGHDLGCAARPETVCDLHCHKYLKMKGGRNPCFIALPSTELNCSRSLSLIMPHQTCEAYDSLDTREASTTSHKFGPLNPCDLSILRIYMVWADWLASLLTCSWKDYNLKN